MKSLGIDFSTTNILDIGSGTGFYIKRWKQLRVKSITGSDITLVAVEKLKSGFPHDEFFQMDIGDDSAGLHQYRYDIISAFDVLFHIMDDHQFEKALQNISILLKPGGLFLFSDNFLHKKPEKAFDQVNRSLKSIIQVLDETGFYIVKRVPMFVLMANPIDSDNQLLKLFWRIIKSSIARKEAIGFVWGVTLYPLELILTSLLKESPTTEMMICKKSSTER
jgi:predicted TPR repeat methyltransferase